jgi:hypothetical protein
VAYAHNAANEYVSIGSPVSHWMMNDDTDNKNVIDSSGNGYSIVKNLSEREKMSDPFNYFSKVNWENSFYIL